MSAWTSPGSSSRSTPASATVGPKRRAMPCMRRRGGEGTDTCDSRDRERRSRPAPYRISRPTAGVASARRVRGWPFRRWSGAILEAGNALLLGAVGAAVERAGSLDPVADHPAPAMGTGRGQGVDGALEAVEGVRPAREGDGERLVVVVPTNVAFRHDSLSWLVNILRRREALGQFDRTG